MTGYLRLDKLRFYGPSKEAEVDFQPGVNVICGASDTGKSFLAEAVDFMLGGTDLKEIPERDEYSLIELGISCTDGTTWALERAISGGDFGLREGDRLEKLRQSHAHDRTDNLSGYLLDKIGLRGKRILKSRTKGTTNSLSFRNLARLSIVQEGEIQQKGSPFWGGQFTLKTAELATIKLLLTGIDELLADIRSDIVDMGEDRGTLEEQLSRLEASVEEHRKNIENAQCSLDKQMNRRRDLAMRRSAIDKRLEEIVELNARFSLLGEHYKIDLERLRAIQESGSLFAFVERTACPLCGAAPDDQHIDDDCDGNVAVTVEAATAEMLKITRLQGELSATAAGIKEERGRLTQLRESVEQALVQADDQIRLTMAPEVEAQRSKFTDIIETRAEVRSSLNLFDQLEKLERRRAEFDDLAVDTTGTAKVAVGFSDAIAHRFSLKLEQILKAWNFPGECRVHYDKDASDFVIDGKPRGSRGKGLRAITHAAVSLALFEFCQEHELPHPGFLLLDSPLLAYFKPEGDEDTALQGTDLKERFYSYLKAHHGRDSQIVVIENQHPPDSELDGLNVTVFTRNPVEGRYGLL